MIKHHYVIAYSREYSMSDLREQYIFDLIRKYTDEIGLVSHQTDSYNHLLNIELQRIFSNVPEIVINEEYSIRFGKVFIEKPCTYDEKKNRVLLTPQVARINDLTYECVVYVNVHERITEDGKTTDTLHKRVPIARIPVMVGCDYCNIYRKDKIENKECDNDIGGYFIIKGKERVLISQERINYNKIYIFDNSTNDPKIPYIAEIRSISEETGHSILTQAKISADGRNVYFSLPFICKDIPAGIVFKALGFYEDMAQWIGAEPEYEDLIDWIRIRSECVTDQKSALEYIGDNHLHTISNAEKKIDYAIQVLDNETFPHLGCRTRKDIAIYFAAMIRKLYTTVTGKRKEDCRDNISLKRVETAGVLVGDLFRMLLKRFVDSLKKYLEKKRPDAVSFISKTTSITSGIRLCFATGNWGVQKNAYIRTGVSQVLSRLTYAASVSHMRRLIIPIGKEGKNVKIRQLHPTQIFFVCPIESPDGQSIGILKNLAYTSRITQNISTNTVIEILRTIHSLGITPFSESDIQGLYKTTKVYVNGVIFGTTSDPEKTLREFRNNRLYGAIHFDVSIAHDQEENEILIYSDEGRFIRPLIRLDNNVPVLTCREISECSWNELIDMGLIVYLDSNEIEHSVIAMTQEDLKGSIKYDYLEIHPSLMLGVSGTVIPYADHNQAPRNCYQTGMIKQALGMYALSHNERTDTISYVLDYPQRPLVTTEYAKMMKYDDMPYGINAIVAIACYTGLNQEDSVILNKASIERGLFVTHGYKTITIEEKRRDTAIYETVEIPPLEFRNKSYNYSKLGSDGIVIKGSLVRKGDVVVGKTTSKILKEEKDQKSDKSIAIKAGEEGIVDQIFFATNSDGVNIIKIKIRNLKIPEIGDKFSSRYSQKGICGAILAQEDMPFTSEGIVPDILINALAMPSRMTIGQLIECVVGKKAALNGNIADSTAFTSRSVDIVDKIGSELAKLGYNQHGYEMMYSGFTGEPLESKIFIGPTYYQRLKHMVSDKIHSRSIGNVTVMMRQPHEGRSRDGGLKLGEMEKDALIVHGASSFIKERLYDMSDPFQVCICHTCGNFLNGKTECRTCKTNTAKNVAMPYACKLLLQELNAMNIKTRIRVK